MTPRKRPLSSRLAELGEAVAAANVYARDVERQHRAAEADVARLTEARVEAFAAHDENAAEELQGERTAADATVAEFAERLEGARRGVQRAEAERAEFATHNLAGLVSERAPEAQAAVRAVTDALDALQAARGAWSAAESECMALLRLAGHNTSSLPRFPEALSNLVRDARRAGGAVVPVPLPREQQAHVAAIAPEHDPDPDVREAARAKLVAEGGRR
jgi:hypothetical protein